MHIQDDNKFNNMQEEFEDTKGTTRISKSTDRERNGNHKHNEYMCIISFSTIPRKLIPAKINKKAQYTKTQYTVSKNTVYKYTVHTYSGAQITEYTTIQYTKTQSTNAQYTNNIVHTKYNTQKAQYTKQKKTLYTKT